MRSLHRKRHAHAESRQRYHRRGAHTYENHLPEDRRDFEKLARERSDKNPVEQIQIELEIIFQSESRRCISKPYYFSVAPSAQNAKLRALTKAEISALLNNGLAGFTVEREWPKAKSMLSARY